MELIFLDTETTGNEVGKDRLCQIAFKTHEEVYVGYFKPPVPVSVKAMSVTHITNKLLEDKEAFQGSLAFERLQKLLNEGILVAHNARFDVAMLECEGIVVPRYIDTLRVARYLDKEAVIPEYNLQYLRYYLGLEIDADAHDAGGDVAVLEAVFNRELEKMMEEFGDRDAAIAKMMEVSTTPTLYTKINFGKYKGQKLDEVLETDRNYLVWLLREKNKTPEAEEDWIYTLNHYLS